jgi:probable rRNA maturation factor
VTVEVVCSDERPAAERASHPIDTERWRALATRSLETEGAEGELTLTFVTRDEIAALNAEHMAEVGATDVLSFPLDPVPIAGARNLAVPILLGDVVISPAVAAAQFADHAGTFEDEIALLVVHGVLHILGHDHVDAEETEVMRDRERTLLVEHHWGTMPPTRFRQDQG